MAQQKEQDPYHDEITVGIAIGIIVGIPVLLWFTAREPVVATIFALKSAEISAIQALVGGGDWPVSGRQLKDGVTLTDVQAFMNGLTNPGTINFDSFASVIRGVSAYTKWPFVAAIAALTIYTAWKMPGGRYARVFRLAPQKSKKSLLPPWKSGGKPDLMSYQADHWQVTAPAIHTIRPDDPDASTAPQHTPLEWLMKKNAWFTKKDGGLAGNETAWNRAHHHIKQQIGPPWPGLKRAPTYVRALVAIFMAHARLDSDSESLRKKISVIWSTESDFDKANAQIEKLIQPVLQRRGTRKVLRETHNKHAFTSTLLLSLLRWCRFSGAMPPNDVQWLKSIDRDLWYAINNLGRYGNGHIDGAGPIAHFDAENVAGVALLEPQVDKAVDGIDQYLRDQGISDLEEFYREEQNDPLYDPNEDEKVQAAKQERANQVDLGLKDTREYIEQNENAYDKDIAEWNKD